MDKKCAIYQTTDFIGKRWTLLIILELYKGTSKYKRYSELKKSIPEITPKILSARLKELEKYGIIEKKIDASEFPVKCLYSLTEAGSDFLKIIKDLKKWTVKWKVNKKECEERDCKFCNV